jgi:ribosomal protein L7/L12
VNLQKFVDALELYEQQELRAILNQGPVVLTEEETALLKDGQLIGAIKSLRYRLSLDLKTAKEICEAHPSWRGWKRPPSPSGA